MTEKETSRRDFIRASVIAGGGLLLALNLPRHTRFANALSSLAKPLCRGGIIAADVRGLPRGTACVLTV